MRNPRTTTSSPGFAHSRASRPQAGVELEKRTAGSGGSLALTSASADRQGRTAPPSGCKTEAAKAEEHHHPRRSFRDARDGAEQTCILPPLIPKDVPEFATWPVGPWAVRFRMLGCPRYSPGRNLAC